jgi:hypothetical protein
VILAFAARIASFLVNFDFRGIALDRSAPVGPGIAGNNGAGSVEPRSTGCMLIGPAYPGLRFCIGDNALPPNLFEVTGLQLTLPAFARRGSAMRKRFHDLP